MSDSPLTFTIYQANTLGRAANCQYPHAIQVSDESSLRLATRRDHVCPHFRNGYRSTVNFESADAVAMDVDNEHSNDPADWVTPEDVHAAFPDVAMGIHFSRHHMQPKKEKAARPRFHVYMACEPQSDPEAYKLLKVRIRQAFPYFDTQALDAAHFFFGTREPAVTFYSGTQTVDECLDSYYPGTEASVSSASASSSVASTSASASAFEDLPESFLSAPIPEGQRNSTLSQFLGKLLKRLGPTNEARDIFLQRAAACDPPLDDAELETIWQSGLAFYKKIASQPGYVAPEDYGTFNGRQYDPEDRTDVGQAEMLVKYYGDKIRYSPETDYLAFNGVRWVSSEECAMKATQEFTKLQLEEASLEAAIAWKRCKELALDGLLSAMPKKRAEEQMNGDQASAYLAWRSAMDYKVWAENRRSSRNVCAVMKQVTALIPIEVAQLDANPHLLNCPSYTWNLRTGEPQEHKAQDYCTHVTAVEPSEEGMDIWQECLKSTFLGDNELIDYVQRICGLACVGKVYFEAMIIAYGDGKNGKSTFWNTLFRVLGSYARTITAESITTSCKRNILPEIAELKGCRLALASELKEGMSLNTSTVKQLTSTDPIHAEKKYMKPFDYVPTHTLVLYTNHLPKVRALDSGTWRRLIVVPFRARFEGQSDIKSYADYLVEHAGGAVLRWVIEGAKKVIAAGYHIEPPQIVRDAIAQYRENNDWLRPFLDEKCDLDPSFKEASGRFYMAYRAWSEASGEHARSTSDFYGALTTFGFDRKKTKIGNFIHGVRLHPDIPPVKEEEYDLAFLN